jgi:hypothetical protein
MTETDSTAAGIVPDTKDWTWVLDESCPECGYDADGFGRDELGERVRASAAPWATALDRPDAATRPDPATWSPLEYACHVRDVHRIFGVRLAAMLEQDQPSFANWDQDETASAERYGEQDPSTVAAELAAAAERVAAQYDAVPADAWGRAGTRSDGSRFTVESLGRYHLHDAVHHVWDLQRGAVRGSDTRGP